MTAVAITCMPVIIFNHNSLSIKILKIGFFFIACLTAFGLMQLIDRSDFTLIPTGSLVKTVTLPFGYTVGYFETPPGVATNVLD